MADNDLFSALWDGWKIKELIGEGSFGEVYRAEKHEYGNVYVSAVKHISIPRKGMSVETVISDGYASDRHSAEQYFESLRDHFIDEINVCYALRGNTNIVSYEDHIIMTKQDIVGYDIFIRMEYLTPLTKYIMSGKFNEDEVIKLGMDICSALMVLDTRHILHRDIKPANIFINPFGVYKLGDFGESKILSGTSIGMTVRGTFAYMSPELSRGEAANITSDIYSLGLVMYRLLNGNRAPFVPVTPGKVDSQIQEQANIRRFSGEKIPSPAFCSDPELCAAVTKACEYSSRDRWQSPEEMKAELERIFRRRKKGILIFSEKADVQSAPSDNAVLQNNERPSENTVIKTASQSQKSDGTHPGKIKTEIFPTENADAAPENPDSGALPADQKKSKKKTPVIIVSAAAAAVLIAAVLIILFNSNGQGTDPGTANTAAEVTESPLQESGSEESIYGADGSDTSDDLSKDISSILSEGSGSSESSGSTAEASETAETSESSATSDTSESESQSSETTETSKPTSEVSKPAETSKTPAEVSKSSEASGSTAESSKPAENSKPREEASVPVVEVSEKPEEQSKPDPVPEPLVQGGSDRLISAGYYHTVGLKKDGTLFAAGANTYGQCDVSSWNGIMAVSAGEMHTVGLKNDGTVLATEIRDSSFDIGQCNVSEWKNIIAVSAGKSHTVGLKKDGTVIAAGDNMFKQCDVGSWKSISSVSAGALHTVGLKKDGTVIAAGADFSGQCDVNGWSGISSVSAGNMHTVGLKKDGTVVAVGENEDGRCNVGSWKNITAVSAGAYHTVGLRKDGTVVAAGLNDLGQCNVSGWTDIVAVTTGQKHTVGLKKDGTLVVAGDNSSGQGNVSGLTLKLPG